MFHIGMWRERLRNALAAAAEGRSHQQPGNADEINEAELPHGIGTPLSDAAARADHLLTEIIDLLEKIGEQSFQWFAATTSSEAVLRNSYTHPRSHICEYLQENGGNESALKLLDEALAELRELSAPPRLIEAMTALREQQSDRDRAPS